MQEKQHSYIVSHHNERNTLTQRWRNVYNVYDAGPASNQHWANMSC